MHENFLARQIFDGNEPMCSSLRAEIQTIAAYVQRGYEQTDKQTPTTKANPIMLAFEAQA